MSLQRTPPRTASLGLTQSESALNTLEQAESSFVNINRNKRQRTDLHTSIELDDNKGLKEEVLGLLTEWKTEFDVKLNEICDKQHSLFTKLSSEISDLKQKTEKIKSSNDEIVNSMAFVNKQYEDIKSGLEYLQKERLEQRRCIESLERKIQDLQIKSRSSTIEIRNIPQTEKETSDYLTDTVRKIGHAVGTHISESDLRDVYRIPGKPGTARPIVAEFQTVRMKINTLAAVRDFNNKKASVEDKINTQLISISGKRQPIYVAEHLPPSSKKLFYLSREFAKKNAYRFCWLSNGNIFLRKAQGEKQILITSEQSLEDLRKSM